MLDMVQNLRDKLSALNLDNENNRAVYDALRRQCQDQGVAFGDLSRLVKQSLDGRPPQHPQTGTGRPHPIIRAELMDSRGNLRATDIEITWQGGDTFLHSVRVVGLDEATDHMRPRPVTTTPYPPVHEHPSCGMSTPRPIHPVCMEIPETPAHRTGQEGRPGYRPAAPMQRFNNKTISWPVWFLHFKVFADVHTDGTGTNEHYNLSRTLTRRRLTSHKSSQTGIMIFLSSCWATDSTRHLESLHLGPDSTAVHDATKRMRTPMRIPLRSCAGWDTHRAHRSTAKNSSVNNSFEVSLIQN